MNRTIAGLALLALTTAHCNWITFNDLSGTEWLCADIGEKEKSAALEFPDLSQKGSENYYRETYDRFGFFESFDAKTGESLMDEEVLKMRWKLTKNESGQRVLYIYVFTDGRWTTDEEAEPPYIVKELTEDRYHTVFEHTWEDGHTEYHEARCIRLD